METFSIILYIKVKISMLKLDLEKKTGFGSFTVFFLIYLWLIMFFGYIFFHDGWLITF